MHRRDKPKDDIGQNFYWYYTSTMANRVIDKTFIGTGAKEDSANTIPWDDRGDERVPSETKSDSTPYAQTMICARRERCQF